MAAVGSLMLLFETELGAREIDPRRALVAGWTGRDRDAVEHHIRELAEIGVPRPSTVPLYYRVSAGLLTQAGTIEVVGDRTSGEAEPVVIDDGDRLWLTLGSDHTDRALEAHSVALSKQICAKPLARGAWDFESVAERLDDLELRSFVREDGGWVAYQEGTLAAIRPLGSLIDDAPGAPDAGFGTGRGRLGRGTVMMCGTLPVLSGGVRPARAMRLELNDPVTARTIALEYDIKVLEAIS